MSKLRYLTSGESHGKCVIGIIEGVPANHQLDVTLINNELRRRQQVYGRGARQLIENDTVDILSGVVAGRTVGSPITISISNKDYVNWKKYFDNDLLDEIAILSPRPGHGDLVGSIKYGFDNARLVAERSSARETAARVGLGGVAKSVLSELKINIFSYVTSIGTVNTEPHNDVGYDYIKSKVGNSELLICDKDKERLAINEIRKVADIGDTLGGKFTVIAENVPLGLGSYMEWDRKLDGILSGAIMSIPAVKSVSIGAGSNISEVVGSKAQDAIYHNEKVGYYRLTNMAGGIEAGISNGEPIVVNATMKPIPSHKLSAFSVNMRSKEKTVSALERGDIMAVPSCAVVGEGVLALEILRAITDKFPSDNMSELVSSVERYRDYIRQV